MEVISQCRWMSTAYTTKCALSQSRGPSSTRSTEERLYCIYQTITAKLEIRAFKHTYHNDRCFCPCAWQRSCLPYTNPTCFVARPSPSPPTFVGAVTWSSTPTRKKTTPTETCAVHIMVAQDNGFLLLLRCHWSRRRFAPLGPYTQVYVGLSLRSHTGAKKLELHHVGLV